MIPNPIDPDKTEQLTIANRADGGVFYWSIKLFGFIACFMIAMIAIACFLGYRYFASETPNTPDLKQYIENSIGITTLVTSDNTLLAEYTNERRTIIPFDQMPPLVVHAFLAAEDHNFYDHHGIYFKGIARAFLKNIRAGDFAQGGSTITQQVAKQFLSSDKSLSRKAKEAIMARRLESRYSKDAILSLYLNQIYLGSGAYGIAEAAHRYFQKDVSELDAAECAMLAGLAQAPSATPPSLTPIEHSNVETTF